MRHLNEHVQMSKKCEKDSIIDFKKTITSFQREKIERVFLLFF